MSNQQALFFFETTFELLFILNLYGQSFSVSKYKASGYSSAKKAFGFGNVESSPQDHKLIMPKNNKAEFLNGLNALLMSMSK